VDPVNMGLVMLPMVVLYFLSIVLASIGQRGRERREARAG
jgi:Sec-independent protein secretion pathway component TatC